MITVETSTKNLSEKVLRKQNETKYTKHNTSNNYDNDSNIDNDDDKLLVWKHQCTSYKNYSLWNAGTSNAVIFNR